MKLTLIMLTTLPFLFCFNGDKVIYATLDNTVLIYKFTWNAPMDGGIRSLSNANVAVSLDNLYDTNLTTDKYGNIYINTTTGDHHITFSIYGFYSTSDYVQQIDDTIEKTLEIFNNKNEHIICSAGGVWEDSLINGSWKLTHNMIPNVLLRFKYPSDSTYYETITNSNGVYSIILPKTDYHTVEVTHPNYTAEYAENGGLTFGIDCHNFFMYRN